MAKRLPEPRATGRPRDRVDHSAAATQFAASAPVPVMALDAQGRLVAWNRACQRLSGYNLAELAGSGWQKLFPDRRQRRAFTDQRKRWLGRPFRDWTWTITTASGEARHLRWTAGTSRSWRAAHVTWAVGRDVTDLHAALESLEVTNEFLSIGQATARFGAWSYDPGTGTVNFTPELEAVYGVPQGKFGRRYSDFARRVYPEDLRRVERVRDRAVARREPYACDIRIRDADGGTRWINVQGLGLHGADGKLRRIVGVDTDVTARRQTEHELEVANQKLQQLAAHLHDTIEEERAAVARDVHDQVGATLTAMRMRLTSMAGRIAPDQSSQRAEILEVAALTESAMHATRDICSRLRPPSLEDIGLAQTCRWHLEEWAQATRIHAVGRFPRRGCCAEAALETDLFRILQELLTNVARHSGATRVQVSLSCAARLVRLRVRDNGHGFREGTARHGFGLAGVRERLRHHDGNVAIQTGPHGTTADVTIPRRGRS